MAIIGISGSPIVNGNTDRIIKAVLQKSGKETKFVNLSKLRFSPCRGCAHRCVAAGICCEKDELQPWLEEIKNADALVLGSAVHHAAMTAWMFSFYSRLWGFCHTQLLLAGKPALYVWSALFDEEKQRGRHMFDTHSPAKYQFEDLGTIYYRSFISPCLKCGMGDVCRRGGLWNLLGCSELALENFEFVPENFRRWEDDPETVAKVEKYGEVLAEL